MVFYLSFIFIGLGRPTKEFSELNDRSKRRRTHELRATTSTEELTFAATVNLRASGANDAALLLNEITTNSPPRASRIRKAWEAEQTGSNSVIPLSPSQALHLMVQGRLSKEQYQLIRSTAVAQNAPNLYPSYDEVLKTKLACYPPKEKIFISEDSVRIDLQALLDLTTNRLLELQQPVIKAITPNVLSDLTFVWKWGSDGTSSGSAYKQKAINSSLDDKSVYVTSLVPLQLYGRENDKKIVVWSNPRPSSTRYTRPLNFIYAKETNDKIKEESARVSAEIEMLKKTSTEIDGLSVTTTHKLYLTMIDGKVCNALTNTSSTVTCNVCGVKPSLVNNLEKVLQLTPNPKTMQLGLSILHFWIRALELILHIAYRIDIKKYEARGPEAKESVAARKREIQENFKTQAGLIVDVTKQGFGTTNDGNTARRFFSDPSMTASITGIEESLIHRLSVVLRAISSGYEIRAQEFEEYCLETAKLYVSLYPWYPMSPSIHKLLIHGPAIVRTFPLPIGMFAEDAQESRNKDFKRFREFNTRKCSRIANNEDLVHMLLISSDPVITGLRKLPKKGNIALPTEVLHLLREPSLREEPLYSDVTNDDSEISEDED